MARGLVLWMHQAVVVPLGRLFGLLPAQRSYEGAKVTRRTSGWYAPSTGPNAEIQGDLVTLRNRHRSLVRDNPWAKRARDALVNNVIGAGIVTQWSSPSRQQRWRDWWESTECDADGLTNGYGLQALVMRTLVESGEVLVYRRRRFGPRGGCRCNFKCGSRIISTTHAMSPCPMAAGSSRGEVRCPGATGRLLAVPGSSRREPAPRSWAIPRVC